jgi:hypothetical protein
LSFSCALLALVTLAGCSATQPKEEPFYFKKDQAKVAVIDDYDDKVFWTTLLWFRDRVNAGAQPSDFSDKVVDKMLEKFSNFETLNRFQQNRMRSAYWIALYNGLSEEAKKVDENTLFAFPSTTNFYPYDFDVEGFEPRSITYAYSCNESYCKDEQAPGPLVDEPSFGQKGFGFVGHLRIDTDYTTGISRVLMSPEKAERVGHNYHSKSKTMLLTAFEKSYRKGAEFTPLCWTMRYTNSSSFIDSRGPNRPLSDHCGLAMDVHRSLVRLLADDHPAMIKTPEIHIALEE